MCFDSLMKIKSQYKENGLIILYGFSLINNSSFCAFISVDKSDNDWCNYVNQLAIDGLPECGLATVCFDAIPLQEVHTAYYMCSSKLKENALQVEYF